MKLKRTAALALAASLIELEVESIANDPEGYFMANDWFDKYGDSSIKFEPQLTSDKDNEFNAAAIQIIATALQKDFASGYWTPSDEDIKNQSFYQYMMPTIYAGYIYDALDKQMAILTGVGYQSVIFEILPVI
jgi:hypothetical protein